ncbi:MAG: energy-coupling factor transporter transmembrane protein EcfT [Coriobacteriales bacterium]|jgi:energy-coupling factor transport system permease protein|nr:energy-coupling factor transporter transmembrane protein EcfT [Coriobacteriales bacterium]
MAIPLPFGNYLARDTPIHRIDARIKLLLLAVYVFAIFACSTWAGLLALLLVLIVLFAVAHIPPRRALRGLKPILFILLFTFIANAFTFSTINLSETIPLLGSFGIRPSGVVKGLYFALRISMLVLVTALLTYTTSVVSLTDATTKLLSPLRALRVPVEDIAMVFTIALRFIPLTVSEAEKLVVAQSARGARFNQGGPLARIKAWIPVMIPLFVNLFRRADHLAQAMESRCYVGKGRTLLAHTHLVARDAAWAIGGSVLLVAVGLLL